MKSESRTFEGSLTTWRKIGNNTYSETTTMKSGFLTVMVGPKLKGDKIHPNPWMFRVTKVDCPNGTMYRNTAGFGEFRNSGVLSETAISPDEDQIGALAARAGEESLNSLLEQLRSADWASNLAEIAANFENPVRQLTDLANSDRMAQARRDAKRKAKGRWRVYVQLMSRAWLQLQYVWQPLVHDIYGTAAALSQHANKSVVVQGRGACSAKPGVGGVAVLTRTIRGPFGGTVSVRCKHVCRFRINGLATAARITSMDPSVIAWNLLPYSFIVDWVYNIGGYLQNMETAAQYNSAFQSGYTTVTTLKDYTFNRSGKDVSGIWDVTAKAAFNEKGLSRSLLVALPTPQGPSVAPDLSSGRLLNLAAILAQALK